MNIRLTNAVQFLKEGTKYTIYFYDTQSTTLIHQESFTTAAFPTAGYVADISNNVFFGLETINAGDLTIDIKSNEMVILPLRSLRGEGKTRDWYSRPGEILGRCIVSGACGTGTPNAEVFAQFQDEVQTGSGHRTSDLLLYISLGEQKKENANEIKPFIQIEAAKEAAKIDLPTFRFVTE